MKALIIANGTLPSSRIVKNLFSSSDLIVCADGGANHARKLRIEPDIILGDLDSITSKTKKYFSRVPMMLIEDQNSTDLEKAIEFCIQRSCDSIDVVGATGDRLDHSTGSLGCFKKFGNKVELKMFDTVGTISRINKKIEFLAKVGEKLSLIPLEKCEGVTTKNLKYALRNDALELGVREGISNGATAKQVTISVKKGTLLLYRFYQNLNTL